MTWLRVADEHRRPGPLLLGTSDELTAEAMKELFSGKPGPMAIMPGEPRRVVWVVKQASGGNVRVLAERHRGIPRPDGTELRFYDGDEDVERRVATFRAGSWHWVVAESALEPKLGEQ